VSELTPRSLRETFEAVDDETLFRRVSAYVDPEVEFEFAEIVRRHGMLMFELIGLRNGLSRHEFEARLRRSAEEAA